MTRLSLHSREENPKLSIRLSIGQYCTVGSSAASDYQLRANGIDPVHCRIGCRQTGGYIECLDDSSTIVVNGVSKDRSRLTHGNTLRIGSMELHVDMPGMEISTRDFDVRFDQEEAPTTKVAEALAVDRDFEATESNDHLNDSKSVDDVDSRQDESKIEFDDTSAEELAHPMVTEPQTAEENNSSSAPSTRSITFTFDSAEIGDVDLSQSDLDEMNETDPGAVVIGNVDLESELLDESTDESPVFRPFDADESEADSGAVSTGMMLENGVNAGKHWKWTGSHAIGVLQQLLEADSQLNVFQCDIKQIRAVEVEEHSVRWFKKQKTIVYLISHLDEAELNQLIRSKRWGERIGHPQAVTMFLALSPRRIVDEFFESISACVLMNEELELVRISNQIDA